MLGARRALFPKLTPTAGLVLDFINGVYSYAGQTYASVMSMPGATFSNATGGYVQTATGLQQVAPNTPRIGVNGYVSELGATNLLANSVGMTGTGWTGQNTTVTANNATAPDGTLTASLNTATGTSATGAGNYTSTGITVASGTQYTASAYFKGGTATYGVLNVNHGPSGGYIAAVFNHTTGVITSVGLLAGTMFNSVTTKSTSIGNGWWRVEITWTAGVAGTVPYIWGQCNSATPAFQAGGNVSVTAGQTNYVWGGQFEAGGAATSYIPTYAAVTNLIQQSNYLANAPWFANSTTATNNAAIAPDGSQTASLVTANNALNGHRIAVTVTASTTYTFSFYVKQGTMGTLKYSVYNLTASSELIAATTYTATTTGWTRISVTFTTPAGCTSVGCYPIRDTTATGTVYVWGCQCELGTSATTFVPVSPAVTNNCTYSQQIGSTSWTLANGAATQNNAVAPDGTTTAALWTSSAATNSAPYKTAYVTASANQVVTNSMYFKAGTSQYVTLNTNSAGNFVVACFDIKNGTVTKTQQAGTLFTGLVASITPAANGYFRCAVSFTVTTSGSSVILQASNSNSATPTFDGSGNNACTSGSTFYMWGAQNELGYGPNLYVATVASTASAAAQTSATLAAQSSASRSPATLVLGSALGLSFSNVKAMVTQGAYLNHLSTNQAMAALNDGTTSNNVLVGSYVGNFLSQLNIGGSLVKSLYQASNIATPTTVRKQGVSFGNSQYVVSQNGSIVSDSGNTNPAYSGTPAFNQLLVGGTLTVTNPPMNGYVRNVQLFSTALTQSQLNSLTK